MRDIIKKDGFKFAFNPDACNSCNGACCRGESGYVWVDKKEIEDISNFLKIDSKEFIREYLKKVGYRYSIKEIEVNGEFQCLFFNEKVGCEIYQVRPKQCKDFPFWDRYKEEKYIKEVCRECKGILL
jgi:Fe-S-cluster containining protein